jgi:hypothetical protein
VAPVKSLFFSFIACYKNLGALTVYGLAWVAILVLALVGVTVIATLLGSPMFAAQAMFPVALLLFAIFFTSVYFTFRDSFTDSLDELRPDPAGTEF